MKTKNTKNEAYSYLRFSNMVQLKGDSQRRQLEGTRNWCKENNARLIEELQDHGVSAFRGKNRMLGVLARFLELVRAGEIKPGTFFIIENIDRLSREKVLEALTLYLELIKSGVSIVTLIDGQTHSRETIQANPMVLQMAIASMSRANEESVVKSRRINSRWKQSRIDSFNGKPSTMGRLPCWLKRNAKTRQAELVPKLAAIILEIFEMSARGMTVRAITVELNSNNRPTLTNRGKTNHWSKSTVHKILNSKAAMGTQVLKEPYKDENGNTKYRIAGEAEGQYPAAVSKEVFAKVQTILKSRAAATPHPKGGSYRSVHNAFSGLCNEMKEGGGVQYTSTAKTNVAGIKYRNEYLRAQNTINKGIAKTRDGINWTGLSTWRYMDFQNLFVATCRLAMNAATNISKEEAELSIITMEAAEIDDSMESLLSMAKKATRSKPTLLAELEKEAIKKEKIEAKAETLRNKIIAAKERRATFPVKVKNRVDLREIIRCNVAKIEIDFQEKLFKARLYSGVEYSCWVSDNEIFVETNDFEVPAGAFDNLNLSHFGKRPKRKDSNLSSNLV